MATRKTTKKTVTAKPEATTTEAPKKAKVEAIETKKDTTKAIETRAAVLKDPAPAKPAVKKAAEKKPAVKRTTAVKAELKTEVFLQFAGKEYSEKDILKKVKEIWTKELKNKVGDMKKVVIYLKPEESSAYYVVNDETTGRVHL